METEKRLIDANHAQAVLVNMAEHLMEAGNPEKAGAVGYAAEVIGQQRTVDAVEVVRCKECRFAKTYERTDGKTGYYCQFCGHSFKYGTNWERLYNPIKESDDFCSYGERKYGDGNGLH